MPDALIAAPLARDWLGKLVKEWAKIRAERRRELDRIFEEFGNVELLAETYVEPDCQTGNPVDLDDDEPTPTWAHRVPVRKWLNDFLQREFKARDGRNTLFFLSDAGMGKSSLLMMLKLSHLLRFWPDGPELHLLKLGQDTLERIGELHDRRKTVLLLDALDEDATAWGRIEDRIEELLRQTRSFRQVIVTCRTQFFPKGGKVPMEQIGKVEIGGFVCNLLYLSPFTDEQVEEYLRKVYPQKLLGRLRRWLTGRGDGKLGRARRVVLPMRSLRMRPMLLAYVEDLLELEAAECNDYRIYEALVDKWLLREERKPGAEVRREDLWQACQHLAMEMQRAGSRVLGTGDLEALLARQPSVEHLTAFQFGGRSLLNRTAAGEYRFSHYSIQEFLVAHRLTQGGLDPVVSLRATDQILDFLASWVLVAPAERLRAVPWAALDFLALEGAVPWVVFAGLAGVEGAQLRELQVPESWQQRAELYSRIPAMFEDPRRALTLVDQLRRGIRDGNDLYVLGSTAAAVGRQAAAAGLDADDLRPHLYNHVPRPPEELFRWIETPLDGRIELWPEIPRGAFRMGSPNDEDERWGAEGPQHQVTFRSPFRMAVVPVTNAQYAAFDPDHPPWRWKGIPESELPSHPVVNVTWLEAMAFCEWLGGCFEWARGARLPTEEEWEYACRAGTETRFWSGDGEGDLARVGWYGKGSRGRTHAVGEKPANPWGLYDVHGNAWEWTLSPWTDDYSSRKDGVEVDPSAVDVADLAEGHGGGGRVIRGGGYWDAAQLARSAYRFRRDPGDRGLVLGFRVLLPAAPSS